MADASPMDVLREYTAKYLNVQAYDLAEMKAFFEEPANDAVAEAYANALSDTLAGEGTDIDTWEELTEMEFEDGEAWLDHLEEVFAYLFENGPYPFGEEPALG
ncbi:hypothetical protein AB2B41_19885 [Marimonas sp. MJW-29]|uniref:CdiI immunity protein domain-containing protein n=1 Tax=Sulfitobacter sediminis TaxID=3234186 RepID=A0ABV3RSA9_9RHOB